MTVASDVQDVTYNTDGVTVGFPIPFYFLRDTDVRADRIDSSGVATSLVLGTDFSLTGAGDPAGGGLTTFAVIAAGNTLHIYRDVPATQETQFQQNDPFPSKTTEKALDKLTMLVQRSFGLIATGIRYPFSEFGMNAVLPTAAARARKALVFKPTGEVGVSQQDWKEPQAILDEAKATAEAIAAGIAPGAGTGTFIQNGAGAVARTFQSKMRDLVSILDFGAAGDGVTDDSAAFNRFVDYLLSSRRGGHIPAGTYKINSQIVIDLSKGSPRGLKIYGDGQQATFLDVSAVTTSPNVYVVGKPDNQGAGFYSTFSDLAIQGNIAGTVLMVGPKDSSAAVNSVEFHNVWVGNNNPSTSACAIQLNYVLSSNFFNVVAACNHGGDAWRLCAVAMCNWVGGAGTWAQYGMRLTVNDSPFGTIAGNQFVGLDFEENVVANIRIDSPNAHDNEWSGGTHVYVPGTTYGVDAVQGWQNIIGLPSLNTGGPPATFANFMLGRSGIALRGVAGLMYGNGPNNPMFNAYMSADQPIAAGTWTKIAFDRIDFQNGNSYDNSANRRFTCQIPGVYEFHAIVQVSATNASLATHRLALYRNGGAMRSCVQNVNAGTNTITLQLTVQCTLSVGDYIEAWANLAAASGNPVIGSGNATSYFSGAFRSN